jgi:type I restriction enzyme S subunit
MNLHNNGRTTATVGELCELVNGRAFKPTDWGSEGLPIIRIQNLNDESKEFNYFDGNYSPKHEVNDGDLLFSWSGTPGTSFGAFFWNRGRGVLNQHIFNVHIDRARVDKRYFRYALNDRLNEIIHHAHGGVGLQHITKGKLEAVEILLPQLSEQKRIADILDKADAIRRKRQEAIAIVEGELLRSAFREQLGDPRTNPKGWPIEQLGNVINFVGGSQPPKETFINEPRPGYVRLVQIRDFKTDKYPTYIPKELARRPFSKDDVMIARYGPPVFQILRGLEGCYNVALMKAENTDRTTKDFIFYLLQIPEIHDVVVANSQRTAGQSGTNLTLLKGLELPIPPIEKQIEIAAILNSIETYRATAQSYCNAAEELFSSLVQRAFKGEL